MMPPWPAVKQMRNKLLMANVGAINLQIDEIGLNLMKSDRSSHPVPGTYDQGQVGQKLTKAPWRTSEPMIDG